jgi:hypothetical protein
LGNKRFEVCLIQGRQPLIATDYAASVVWTHSKFAGSSTTPIPAPFAEQDDSGLKIRWKFEHLDAAQRARLVPSQAMNFPFDPRVVLPQETPFAVCYTRVVWLWRRRSKGGSPEAWVVENVFRGIVHVHGDFVFELGDPVCHADPRFRMTEAGAASKPELSLAHIAQGRGNLTATSQCIGR